MSTLKERWLSWMYDNFNLAKYDRTGFVNDFSNTLNGLDIRQYSNNEYTFTSANEAWDLLKNLNPNSFNLVSNLCLIPEINSIAEVYINQMLRNKFKIFDDIDKNIKSQYFSNLPYILNQKTNSKQGAKEFWNSVYSNLIYTGNSFIYKHYEINPNNGLNTLSGLIELPYNRIAFIEEDNELYAIVNNEKIDNYIWNFQKTSDVYWDNIFTEKSFKVKLSELIHLKINANGKKFGVGIFNKHINDLIEFGNLNSVLNDKFIDTNDKIIVNAQGLGIGKDAENYSNKIFDDFMKNPKARVFTLGRENANITRIENKIDPNLTKIKTNLRDSLIDKFNIPKGLLDNQKLDYNEISLFSQLNIMPILEMIENELSINLLSENFLRNNGGIKYDYKMNYLDRKAMEELAVKKADGGIANLNELRVELGYEWSNDEYADILMPKIHASQTNNALSDNSKYMNNGGLDNSNFVVNAQSNNE